MSTVPSETPRTNTDESEYPRHWNWVEDGLTVEGTYVKTDSAPSAYGQKAILVLSVEGEERSIWITTEALRAKLAAELERRKARNFDSGERISITRGAEKKVSANDREYWPFTIHFPDAPASDTADLLGASLPSGGTDRGDEGPNDDGDVVPF